MIKSRIQVQNLGIQDTCTIDFVICLQKSPWKSCLYYFLSVLTLGFFWLLGYWSAKLKSRLVFTQCSVISATHFLVYNWDSKWCILQRDNILALSSKNIFKQSIIFTNRHIKYFYDEAKEAFHSFKFNLSSKLSEFRQRNVHIYSEQSRDKLHKQFGRCLVEVKVHSMLALFLHQILSPYQMFQLYAIIYWLITEYYIFPSILLAASIATYIYDVRLLQKGQIKLRTDSLIATAVSYLSKDSNNKIKLLRDHSEVLVPGDLFYIGEKQIVPCDCVVLKGSAFINEEYLSGNSTPIRKAEIPDFELNESKESDSTLYMGTEVICVEHEEIHNQIDSLPTLDYKSVLCLAVRTNYSCFRGQYLRSIIYPKKHAFKFFNQSLSFLAIMFLINILGFFFIFSKVKEFLHASHGLILFLELLTTAIPPTLPTAMSVGIGFAMRRLTALDIRCMIKQKILVGGRIDTVMIESSNLISKSEVKMLGFINNNPGGQMALKLLKQTDNALTTLVKQGMASTLAASRCEYDGKYLGSPYDLQILQFSGANIDTNNINIKLANDLLTVDDKIYHEHNFIESLVLVGEQKHKFLRGPWEKVIPLCSQNKISANIQEIIQKLTSLGYLVLALGHREIFLNSSFECEEIKFNLLGLIVIQQKQEFNGFPIIQTLKSANIHSITLSKQNSTNSIKTALKSGIITNKDIMYCELIKQQNGDKKIHKMYPEYINHALSEEKQQISTIISNDDEITKDFVFGVDELKPLQICMSGNLLEELHTRRSISSIRHVLEKTVIFCNLQQKHYSMIVQSYQQLGRLVSIVGDNVRDNAFKQADIGLALTSSDLSALSHFSARKSNTSSIVSLLTISKAGLSCNFQTFKMMCLFSLTQFTTYIVLYMNYQQLNNTQNLYIDLFIMCPIFICLSLTEPCQKLSKQKPPASLFSLSNVLSMAGLFVIQFIAQFMMIYSMRSRKYLLQYEENSLKYILQTDEFNQGTYEATNIFVFSNFLYIGIALATSVSRPFRKQFYTNIPLVLTILSLWIYNVIIPFDFLVPESMEIKHLHSNWIPIVILAANFVCLLMYLYQNLILAIINRLKRKYQLE